MRSIKNLLTTVVRKVDIVQRFPVLSRSITKYNTIMDKHIGHNYNFRAFTALTVNDLSHDMNVWIENAVRHANNELKSDIRILDVELTVTERLIAGDIQLFFTSLVTIEYVALKKTMKEWLKKDLKQ